MYQARVLHKNRPMILVAGLAAAGVGAFAWNTISMGDKREVDAAAVQQQVKPSSVPDGLLREPRIVQQAEAEPVVPVQAIRPPQPAAPPPKGPSIEDIARSKAAEAAWTVYFAAKAEIEKKRIAAVESGLISPLTPVSTQSSSAAPPQPSSPVVALAQQRGGGGSISGGGGTGTLWAAADSKQSWADRGPSGKPDYVDSLRHGTPSPYEIMAGTSIKATTRGGIISDSPGQIVGQVSQDVQCNTPAGIIDVNPCIPRGSTIILSYNNRVSQGEKRIEVAAERLIFPDSTSMDLGHMIVGDSSGYSGLEDEVETHLGERLLNATLFTAVQGAFTLGATALGAQQVSGQAVESVASDEARAGMRIPPTLRIRPGFPMTVMLPQDLVFESPYVPQESSSADAG